MQHRDMCHQVPTNVENSALLKANKVYVCVGKLETYIKIALCLSMKCFKYSNIFKTLQTFLPVFPIYTSSQLALHFIHNSNLSDWSLIVYGFKIKPRFSKVFINFFMVLIA